MKRYNVLSALILSLLIGVTANLSAQTPTFGFTPNTITGNVGDVVTIKVVGKNMSEIEGVQFSMQFDTSKIQLVDTIYANVITDINPNCGGLGSPANFNLSRRTGRIGFTWVVTNAPLTLAPNDSLLFGIKFIIKNNSNIGLAYTDAPVAKEVTRNGGQTVTPNVECISGSAFYATASGQSATCNGVNPNNDAKLILAGLPNPLASQFKYQYSPGATFNSGTATPSTPQFIPTNLTISNINNPAAPQQYTVRITTVTCTSQSIKDIVATIEPANCGCTPPSYNAATAAATCNGSTANSDGKITLSNFPTSAQYQYSFGSFFASGSAVPPSPTNIPSNGLIASNLPNPSSPQAYTIRVYSSTTCFKDTTVMLASTSCGGGCTPPTYTATTTAATCNGTVANNNGMITLSNFPSSAQYQFSLGSTFNGGNATPSNPTNMPTNGVIANALPNPSSPQAYTVRVYSSTTCFKDTTVTLASTNCSSGCTPPTYTAIGNSATCNGTIPNSNASITLSGFGTGLTYQYSTGTSFNGGSAIPATAASIPTNGIIVSNLPNPSSSASYTVRVYSSTTCFTDKTVTINAANCGGAPPSGGNVPVKFTIVNDSATTGTGKCVDVRVENFSKIAGFQYTIKFNPNLLQFTGLGSPQPTDSLPGFSQSGNIGNLGNGVITVTWDNPSGSGVTRNNGTTIFRLCFNAIGAGGSQDTLKIVGAPTSIEATRDTTGNPNVGITPVNGIFKILGTGGPITGVSFKASSESGFTNDVVCVKVTVDNFNNVEGMQYSMNWNPSKLKFVGPVNIPSPNPLPGFSTSGIVVDSVNGNIKFTWLSTNSPSAVTLPNGTQIYSLCFRLIGSAGQSDDVQFSDNPLPHEINVAGGGQASWVTTSGKVTIKGNTGDLTVETGCSTAMKGSLVCVPVKVTNFNAITGLQFSLNWDSTVLKFNKIEFPSPQVLDAPLALSNFNTPLTSASNKKDRLAVAGWVATDATNGQTLPAGTTIFNVCFDVIGNEGTMSSITPSDIPVFHEFLTASNTNANWNPLGCKLTVSSTPAQLAGQIGNITPVGCNGGQNGSATVSATGGTTPYTYIWSSGQTTSTISNVPAGNYSVTIRDNAGQSVVLNPVTITQPSAISITGGTITPFTGGNNGAVSGISVTGGTPNYSYQWNTNPIQNSLNISNLPAGTYMLVVTDANLCTKMASYTVPDNSSVPVNLSVSNKTDVTCFGGSNGTITLATSGGNGTFNYTWNPATVTGGSPTGLKAGTYTVTVTSGINTATTQVVINQPADIIVNSTIDNDVACFGGNNGKVTLDVTGGTPNYNYAWNNNAGSNTVASGLAANVYTVTVTDSKGCVKIKNNIEIKQPTAMSLASKTETAVKCFGGNDGSINVTINGGTPNYTYAWSGTSNTTANPTGLTAGSYTLTVTDNNQCKATYNFAIGGPATALDGNGTASGNAPNGSVSINVSGGTPNYTYSWSGPCNFTSSSQNVSNLSCEGDYYVTVTDNNQCKKVLGPFKVLAPPLVVTSETQTDVKCFGDKTGDIIVNVTGGIQPLTYKWTNDVSTTNAASGLAAGTYSVSITENGKTTPTVVKTFIIKGPVSPLTIKLDTAIKTQDCKSLDGQIYITATGGTPGYSYKWNNGSAQEDLIGIAMGLYKVDVTDKNGCVTTLDNIQMGSSVKTGYSNLEATPVKCLNGNDGKITMKIFGCAPYNLSWGPDDSQKYKNFNFQDISINNLKAGDYTLTLTSASDPAPLVITIKVPTSPNAVPVNITGTVKDNSLPAGNPNCNGTITNVVFTPAGNYTFKWLDNPGITSSNRTNLCEGDYTVIIINSDGCEVGDTTFKVKSVVVLPLKADVVSVKDVQCRNEGNGSIKISVSGGALPYNFIWRDSQGNGYTGKDSIINLNPGKYSVTVFDVNNTEVSIQSIEVKQLSSLDATVTFTATYASVAVTGESGNLKYTWSSPITSTGSTANNLTPETTYSVTICDTYCCVVKSFTTNCALTAAISADKSTSCNGSTDGVASVRDIKGCISPYKVLWDNNVTSLSNSSLSAGIHNVTVTDAQGTNIVLSVDIKSGVGISNVTFKGTLADCKGAPTGTILATPTGGITPYSYAWNIPGGTDGFLTNLVKGSYTVTVTDANKCQVISTFALGDDCDEFPCFKSIGTFSPNDDGANDELKFNLCDHESSYLQIFDRWGQLVYEVKNFSGNNAWDGKIDGENAPVGGYFYVLEVKRLNTTEIYKGSFSIIR